MKKLLQSLGRSVRGTLVGLGALAFLGTTLSIANYAVTQGSGTNFASVVISTVHYAAQLICDPTTGSSNCAAVKAGNAVGTTDNALAVSDANVLAAVTGAIPAGTNLIGKVGIDQTTDGTTNGVRLTSEYPSGATASNGSTTGTTGATSTTLAAQVGATEYVCGISIRANATAAATGNATLSDGTKTYNFTQWTAPNASGLGIIEEVFTPCRPASGTNTAWTLTSAAPGTGGVVSVAIWGYYK